MTRWTRVKLEAAIEANGGPKWLDLAGDDLSGLDLSGMDLSMAIFSRWDVEAKHWCAADLRGAVLARYDDETNEWHTARLRGAVLSGVDLSNTVEARRAILADADLRQVDLIRADLWRAVLQRSDLRGADLYGAKLHGAWLQGANLSGDDTDLTDANLQRAWLGGACLQGTKLVEAKLCGASLVDSRLEGANLTGADLRGAYARGASFEGANLNAADLRGLDLRRVAEGGLAGVYLHNAKFGGTRLSSRQLAPKIGEERQRIYDQARDAYLALKQDLEALGDHEGAVWSYLKARQTEKVCNTPWLARHFHGKRDLGDSSKSPAAYHPRLWWFYIKHTRKWVTDWVVELICNYGEGPWRTVATMAVVYLLFAALYWARWAVVREMPRPDGIVDLVPTRDVMDVAVFTLGAFTTMDAEGVRAISPGWQVVAGVEALVGVALTGLLGFVVGNRIRRS